MVLAGRFVRQSRFESELTSKFARDSCACKPRRCPKEPAQGTGLPLPGGAGPDRHIARSDVGRTRGRSARPACLFRDIMERADMVLRQWPVAGLSLLALMVVLGVALVG
jgi:hypothetical protein